MEAVVGELAQRVRLAPTRRIVLLVELDSLYGRSLPRTFQHALEHHLKTQNVDSDTVKQIVENVETVYYPEGIDGKTPADRKDDKPPTDGASREKEPGRPREATEGANQSDYVRRLAAELRERERTLRWRRQGGISAVGVLGADVFDKIMILRALRGALPEAIFFTNDLDARLGHPDEWDATHNLVVASTYGMQLEGHAGVDYAPFRDSYETSTFAATLKAMKGRGVPHPSVHLYEIGLTGPFRLDVRDAATGRDWASTRRWLLGGVLDLRSRPGVLGTERAGTHGSRVARPALGTLWTSTPVFLLVALVSIALLLAAFESLGGATGEPMVMLDGISIWPSEAIRLLAAMLGVHFIAKSMDAIRANDVEVGTRFHIGVGSLAGADGPYAPGVGVWDEPVSAARDAPVIAVQA